MSLPEMRVELDELLERRTAVEAELANAQRQYKIGMWAILLGLPLLLAYGLGALFIIAGILAAVTNAGKKGKYQAELEEVNTKVAELRREIARLESDK